VISSPGSFISFDPQRPHRFTDRCVCGISDQSFRLLQNRGDPSVEGRLELYCRTLKVQGTSGLGRITHAGNIPFPIKVKFLRQLHPLKFLLVHYWPQYRVDILLCGPASVIKQ
jgi:hypothetical protein